MIWINLIANAILTIAFTMFMIFVFGRKNSKIYSLPWYKTIAVKAGLAICTAASFMNCLTLSNPPISEIMLNMGLAMMFTWAAWFHYRNFVLPYKMMVHTCPKVSTSRKPRVKKALK